jgi:DnaK suppressor protein
MTSLSTYQELITKKLAELEQDLSSIATHTVTGDDWEAVPEKDSLNQADDNLEADGLEEWESRRAATADLEIEYANCKRALAKIEAGTFGSCEICSALIEEARLLAKPTARTCVAHRDEEGTLSL